MANFEFTETSEIDTVWNVGGVGVDWLAMVYRDHADAPWKLRYRFRYHNPASEGRDIFDHQDTFSTYEIVPKDQTIARESLIAATDALAVQLPFGKVIRIEVKGNAERFAELIKDHPFFHTKIIPATDEPKGVM